MKATTRHELEVCFSASELLELCSTEDLAAIPPHHTPAFKAVRFDPGSVMLTAVLSFVPLPAPIVGNAPAAGPDVADQPTQAPAAAAPTSRRKR